jgi:uncharacterized membrane protein (UPF0127 family)
MRRRRLRLRLWGLCNELLLRPPNEKGILLGFHAAALVLRLDLLVRVDRQAGRLARWRFRIVRVYNQTRGTLLASSVEIPSTDRERARGLLGRSSFPEGCCMWLVPCERIHTRGMAFPIDLVWLDGALRVLAQAFCLEPGCEGIRLPGSRSVLELPAGMVVRSGTQAGDLLRMLP